MPKEGGRSGWWLFAVIGVILFLIILGIFSFGGLKQITGNVAVIKIDGEVFTDGSSFGRSEVSSTDIIRFIDEAEDNPTIKAVLFEINSPGGSAVASYEVVQKIREMKKPRISVIREVGASGAYWIASSTDYIIANPLSITGSIGVTASYPEFADFLTRYNVTYQKIIAGKYKDIGNPLSKQSKEELNIMQDAVDSIHQVFLNDVMTSRKLTKDELDQISTATFFLGMKAKELDLVDQLGTKEDAEKYLEQKLNTSVEFVEYSRPKGLLESVFGAELAFNIGQGIGSAITEKTSNAVDVRT